MPKLALAVAVLLLPLFLNSYLFAQAAAPKKAPATKAKSEDAALPKGDTFVDELTLTGVSKLSKDEQQKIVDDVEDHQYPRNDLNEIRERVLYGLQTRGYFRAKVSDPEIKVLSQTPRRQVVAASLNVTEGEQYRLKDITFSGARAVSADELRKQFPLQNGDIFDTAKIRTGVDAVRRLYASKGYSVTPVPNVHLDDAAHLVTLNIDVDEGPAGH